MRRKNVFVIALDRFNRRKLEALRCAGECRFHRLLSDEVLSGEGPEGYDVERIITEGMGELDAFDGPVDAVIAYRDFPESSIQPILARHCNVQSASLEAVLQCEHKYWSRVEQLRAVPENVPAFTRFRPFDPDPRSQIDLDYPFWMKPVKSFASHLGFKIENDADFERALDRTRRHVRSLTAPFQTVTRRAAIPEDVADNGETYCIAEQIVSGHQCTLEGCRSAGETFILGIVDSIRFPGTSSFCRYQYPSSLPENVKQQMRTLAQRLVEQIGYDNACFNIEFFWNESENRIWLLEINPRIAFHHADLFEKVHGYSNYEMAVQVALGRQPDFELGAGPYAMAATCFWREFEDGVVLEVPSDDQLCAIEKRYDALVEIKAKPHKRLSELPEQDAYSYQVALIYVGGDREEELIRHFEQVRNNLGVRIARES